MLKYLFHTKRGEYLFFYLLLGMIISGCKKFVQIGPPPTQLVTTSVFNNITTATAAQTAIYTSMAANSESWVMAQDCGLLSDELTSHSNELMQVLIYTNALTSNHTVGIWTTAYNYIYQANSIISGLKAGGINSANSSAVNQLIGEAKFIRAFWLFYLTNLYGDIPLVTSTSYTINQSISRSPQSDVYNQIVSDLTDAKALLNANFVDVTDTTISTERVRPTKGAAESLLARVYLYMQKYDLAAAEATLVIGNNNLFQLCGSLSGSGGVFMKNSTEAVWQISTPLPAAYNTPDGQNFILVSDPTTGSNNSTTISTELLNSFESGDQRKAQWIGAYPSSSSPTDTFFFPYKYQSYNASSSTSDGITEYIMVLRLAEQYLIRAESRAQQGDVPGAVSDLNVIRERAGLNDYSGTMDQATVLNAILHERQVELFTEWGHRWFDLIRTHNIDGVMGGANGVCHAKGGTWVSTEKLLPISQSERNNDPNLSQTPGY